MDLMAFGLNSSSSQASPTALRRIFNPRQLPPSALNLYEPDVCGFLDGGDGVWVGFSIPLWGYIFSLHIHF